MSNAHMIFVVYGASGSGKSAILNMISDLSDRVSIHRKDTDRKQRPTEKGKSLKELRFVSSLKQEDYALIYEQFGNKYGIRKDILSKAFENHELHFIIIGNVESIKKMKALYPYMKTIYVHYSPEEIPKRFLERDPLEYEKRKLKIEKQYDDFLKHNTFFDHIIINFWDLETSKRQIRNIMRLYSKEFDFDINNK